MSLTERKLANISCENLSPAKMKIAISEVIKAIEAGEHDEGAMTYHQQFGQSFVDYLKAVISEG